MISLVAVLLITAPTPVNYCQELDVELRIAVRGGVLTDKEADEILRRCLLTAPAP